MKSFGITVGEVKSKYTFITRLPNGIEIWGGTQKVVGYDLFIVIGIYNEQVYSYQITSSKDSVIFNLSTQNPEETLKVRANERN